MCALLLSIRVGWCVRVNCRTEIVEFGGKLIGLVYACVVVYAGARVISARENFFEQSRTRKCDDLMIFTRLINTSPLHDGSSADAHMAAQDRYCTIQATV